MGRNHSFNTTLNGLFLDRLTGTPTAREKGAPLWLAGVSYGPARASKPVVGPVSRPRATLALAEAAQDKVGAAARLRSARVACWRAGQATREPEQVLAAWRWRLPWWAAGEHEEFGKKMAQVRAARQALDRAGRR